MATSKQAKVSFSSYSITADKVAPVPQGDNVGKVVTRNVIVTGITCDPSELLDVSAFTVLPDTGQTTLRIRNFLCHDDLSRYFAPPMNIVATPVSAAPIFTTVTHFLIFDHPNPPNRAVDVEFHLFAWDANGAPAPHVTVNWRCRVPVYTVIP